MKILTISRLAGQIIFIISIILCLSISCKKNNEDVINNYRIIKSSYYVDDTLKRVISYNYADDRIAIARFYLPESYDSVKTNFEYPNDSIVLQKTSFKALITWYPFMKYIIEYRNGKIISTATYYLDGSYWEPYTKEDYQYDNEFLSEEIWYYYQSLDWVPDLKISYNSGIYRPVKADYFDYLNNSWVYAGMDTLIRAGDRTSQITSFTCFSDTCLGNTRFDFIYSGESLTRMEVFYKYGDYWDQIGQYLFTYDHNNNLLTEEVTDEISTQRYVYEYEPGSGNYTSMISPGGGLVGFSNYPIPTKSSRISGLSFKYMDNKVLISQNKENPIESLLLNLRCQPLSPNKY
jgi:hypothetical protein